jgi:hypothetical protein
MSSEITIPCDDKGSDSMTVTYFPESDDFLLQIVMDTELGGPDHEILLRKEGIGRLQQFLTEHSKP